MQIDLPFSIQQAVAGIWKIEESEDWFLSQLHIWPEEALALEKILSPQKRLQWLSSRLVVRRLLNPEGKVISQHYEDGRPRLVGLQQQVSFTHTGDWAMAMICPSGQIPGVDIELSDRIIPEIVQKRFLNPPEWKQIIAAGNQENTLKILAWSAKETLFKCIGRKGISFQQDLCLHLPQEITPGTTGIIPAKINYQGNEKAVTVSYFFFRNLVCTWLVVPDDTFSLQSK
jgi:4'-phosphopantetheinyl transferase